LVAQPERAETAGDPAETFSGCMRIIRVRVGRANDFPKQNERWIGELMFFKMELNETSSP